MNSRKLVKLLGLTALAVVGVMAVSASAAQAKLLLLLNGASIKSLKFNFAQVGNGSLVAENGLKIECGGGSGTMSSTSVEEGLKVTAAVIVTFTDCKWIGSETFCTINDAGVGQIRASGTGQIFREGSNYLITVTSNEFTEVFTEGFFCTIPEKEVIAGTAHALINNALADTQSKTVKLLNLSLKLGNSKVKSLNGEVLLRDENLNASFGFHSTNLTGCTPIC